MGITVPVAIHLDMKMHLNVSKLVTLQLCLMILYLPVEENLEKALVKWLNLRMQMGISGS